MALQHQDINCNGLKRLQLSLDFLSEFGTDPPLVVDIALSKVYLLAELTLFFHGQVDELHTLLTAAFFILFFAGITLDEQ